MEIGTTTTFYVYIEINDDRSYPNVVNNFGVAGYDIPVINPSVGVPKLDPDWLMIVLIIVVPFGSKPLL